MTDDITRAIELFALFKDGKQISKPHSTRYAVEIEALECGAMVTASRDWFGGLAPTVTMSHGYEIRPVQSHQTEKREG